jgi:hypothetical protein
VKGEMVFKQSASNKSEDPGAWTDTFEECRMKLEGIGSPSKDNHLMKNVCNSQTSDYELQIAI